MIILLTIYRILIKKNSKNPKQLLVVKDKKTQILKKEDNL